MLHDFYVVCSKEMGHLESSGIMFKVRKNLLSSPSFVVTKLQFACVCGVSVWCECVTPATSGHSLLCVERCHPSLHPDLSLSCDRLSPRSGWPEVMASSA